MLHIFSNIIVHSRICESYNLKQSYVEVIRKRLGSECKEGSWAIVQSGVTLENHRLLCPLLDIYTTYYIFLQKKKIESSFCYTYYWCQISFSLFKSDRNSGKKIILLLQRTEIHEYLCAQLYRTKRKGPGGTSITRQI